MAESKNQNRSHHKKTSNQGTMSRSEAASVAGSAPHRCRGRECSKSSSSKHTTQSDRNTNSNYNDLF